MIVGLKQSAVDEAAQNAPGGGKHYTQMQKE